jgi:hypothetical protein
VSGPSHADLIVSPWAYDEDTQSVSTTESGDFVAFLALGVPSGEQAERGRMLASAPVLASALRLLLSELMMDESAFSKIAPATRDLARLALDQAGVKA